LLLALATSITEYNVHLFTGISFHQTCLIEKKLISAFYPIL